MTPELHWSDDANGARSLFAGNLPHAIARGVRRPSGIWRYDLELPGAHHIAISVGTPREASEELIEVWASAWFAAVTA